MVVLLLRAALHARARSVVHDLRVVAQLAQLVQVWQHLHERASVLAVVVALDVLVRQEVRVQVLLQFGEVDAHDGHQLGRQEFRVQSVGASQDERVHQVAELRRALLALRARVRRGVRFAAVQDGRLKVAPEALLLAEHAGVGEVNHRKELVEVVLQRRATQQHAAARGELVQADVRLRVAILQPVRLVADEKLARLLAALVEFLGVDAERLVAHDEHLREAARAQEVRDARIRVLAVHSGERDRLAKPLEPLGHLGVPVGHEAGRAHDDGLADHGLAVESLLQQRPQECDALQGLAEAHVVRKDAPTPLVVAEPSATFEEELGALALVRPQPPAEHLVHLDHLGSGQRVGVIRGIVEDERRLRRGFERLLHLGLFLGVRLLGLGLGLPEHRQERQRHGRAAPVPRTELGALDADGLGLARLDARRRLQVRVRLEGLE
mmetsp:Transcript_11198/g.46663  ORF Transcript_11198/g.46663 Transcript_11198/m.46663 type:complete len:438 (-) Transcript_11198:4-1317(-)